MDPQPMRVEISLKEIGFFLLSIIDVTLIFIAGFLIFGLITSFQWNVAIFIGVLILILLASFIFLTKILLRKKKKIFKKTAIILFSLIIFFIFGFFYLFQPARIVGASVAGGKYQEGQTVLGEKITYLFRDPKVGDIVTFVGLDGRRMGQIYDIQKEDATVVYLIKHDADEDSKLTKDRINSRIYWGLAFKASQDLKKKVIDQKKLLTSTPQLEEKTTECEDKKENDKLIDFDLSDYAQIRWQTPSRIDDLGLFQKQKEDYFKTDYYKLGGFINGDEMILAVVELEGWSGSSYYDIHRFIKRDDDYIRLTKVSSEINSAYKGVNFKDSDNLFLGDFLPDEKIIIGSTRLSGSKYWVFTEEASNDLKIGATDWGDLFLEYKEGGIEDSNGQVLLGKYYIKLKDSTRLYYSPTPIFIRDDDTFDISWKKDPKENIKFYKMPAGGCGGAGFFALINENSSSLLSLKEIGISDKGSKIYFIDNKGDQLVNYSYQFYAKNSTSPASIEDFINGLGLVFWRDDFNNIIPYVNSEFTPPMECAKPVIYLYPEEEIKVKVKVGAEITKSEPQYSEFWEVIARPDGQLFINNNYYPYLFWEGLGFGFYPKIDKGIVVEREKVEETIRSQLSFIGLNNNEINNFLDFWFPLMPENRFIRLSWLQNEEMAELAPLKIDPQPKSIIRVFLDFQGLDEFVNLPSQELKKIKRNGFTVVEWGGLRKVSL